MDASCSTSNPSSKTYMKVITVKNHDEVLEATEKMRVQPKGTVLSIYFHPTLKVKEKEDLLLRLTNSALGYGKDLGFEVIIIEKEPDKVDDQDESCDSSDDVIDYSSYRSFI